MNGSVHGWWELLAALAVVVLPLLWACWLLARSEHLENLPGDNEQDRRDPS